MRASKRVVIALFVVLVQGCSAPLDTGLSEAEVYLAMYEALAEDRATRPVVHPLLIVVEDPDVHPAEYAFESNHFAGAADGLANAATLAGTSVCELAEDGPWCDRSNYAWVAFSGLTEGPGSYTAWANYVEHARAPAALYSFRIELRVDEDEPVVTLKRLDRVN